MKVKLRDQTVEIGDLFFTGKFPFFPTDSFVPARKKAFHTTCDPRSGNCLQAFEEVQIESEIGLDFRCIPWIHFSSPLRRFKTTRELLLLFFRNFNGV